MKKNDEIIKKESNNIFRNPIFISVMILWIFWAIFSFIYWDTPWENRGNFKFGEWGDSFGVVNALTSLIVLYYVYSGYELQKEELKKTSDALEGQENAMRDQKLQTMIISLLELARNHLNEFRDTLVSGKFSTPNGRDVISLYVHSNLNIESDTNDGILNSAIYYFRTLKYIENLIIKESLGDQKAIRNYIDLLESQITENLQHLHGLLLASKGGIDKDKITFEYLFSNEPPIIAKKEQKKSIPEPFNSY